MTMVANAEIEPVSVGLRVVVAPGWETLEFRLCYLLF